MLVSGSRWLSSCVIVALDSTKVVVVAVRAPDLQIHVAQSCMISITYLFPLFNHKSQPSHANAQRSQSRPASGDATPRMSSKCGEDMRIR